MGGFTDGGLKLQSSVASTMVDLMPAAAPAGPYVVAIMAAIAFAAEVIAWMSGDDDEEIRKAIRMLQEAIEHQAYLLDVLDERLDEMTHEQARESNRQTNRDLKDYLDEVGGLRSQLENLAGDAGIFVDIANRAGIVADKFLRDDFDIWRWSDVVLKEFVDPNTGRTSEQPDLALGRFKNVPTLPVYLLAVLTWLTARERVLALGAATRLNGDDARVRAHLAAVTVRPEFREHAPEELYPDGRLKWTPVPATLPENIKARIIGLIRTSTRYPEDGYCEHYFDVQNWMTGEQAFGEDFRVPAVDRHALCTVDPLSIGAPLMELDWEERAGVAVLEELRQALARAAFSGTVREPFVGRFPNWVASKSNYYGVNVPGQLVWFEHLWRSDAPGVPAALSGPHVVAGGWNRYGKIVPAGGRALYALADNGDLLWFEHAGAFDGQGDLTGPRVVGTGWGGFKAIVPGGNGVVYAIAADGTLWWYKHDAFESGGEVSTWRPPKQVGTGWATTFTKVFAGGNEGVLYGVLPDGTLRWYRHTGVADGADTWEGPHNVGTGWHNFDHIFGTLDGQIYAKARGKPLRWYRHRSWEHGISDEYYTGTRQIGIEARLRPMRLRPIAHWDGPVDVGDDTTRYVAMFAALPKPLPGGGVR